MISNMYNKGMIFMCDDNFTLKDDVESRHNYLIIGINENRNYELGFIQCMSITSMRNKEIDMEVPIRLCNNYVSYIIPYNIHSLHKDSIKTKNYKGCICDTSYMKTDEFFSLLMDIYMDSIGMKNHSEVRERYDKYCADFWAENANCKEFREVSKISSAMYIRDNQTNNSMNDTEVSEILSSVVKNTKSNIQSSSQIDWETATKINKDRKKRRGKTTKARAKNRELKRISKEMKNFTDEYTDTNVNNIIECKSTERSADKFSIINNAPKYVRDWSDEQILLFIDGYISIGGMKLSSLITRITDNSHAYHINKSCLKEAQKRGLKIESKKDPLKRPLKEWTDQELMGFISLMNQHNGDVEFKLKYTGFKNSEACANLCYRIKKEIERRTLVS